MHYFANPQRFARLAKTLMPWTAALAIALIAIGIPWGLVASPPDYQQGETVRIMYIHVPAAWLAMFVYANMTIASIAGLVWRHPVAHLFVRAVAPVGAAFTALCLITGSIWGAPTWGTWWVWDARLTSVLILLFVYLGYLALLHAFDDEDRGERSGAVLILVGSVNLPIIKFSVDWWNTLHQPASVSRFGTPAIHPDMLGPLLVMAVGMMALFFALAFLRTRTEIAKRRVRSLRLMGGLARDRRATPARLPDPELNRV